VTANGRLVPRDELADALWGDAVPATWEKALGVLASKLRTVLSETGVATTALTAARGCYRLELPEGAWVDVLEATAAAHEAEALLAGNDPDRAAATAASAEPIARLPFLPGDDAPWVQAKRRELDDVRVRAVTVLAEASLQTDRPADAVRWAEQAVEAEPFRESGYRLLMTAHIAAGNRAEALRVYERCRRLLADELGTYPSPETDSLYRELLDKPPPETAPTADAPGSPDEAPPSGKRKRLALVVAAVVIAGVAAAAFALADSKASASKLLPDSVIRIDPHTLKATEVGQVGDAPDLIVASGGYLWVTNWVLRDSGSGAIRPAADHLLWRVDPSTGQASPVGGGVSPCGIAADPSGNVWVANCFKPGMGQRSNVVPIDAKTGTFGSPILVPYGTSFFRGITFGGGALWVGDSPGAEGWTRDTVFQIDPQTGKRDRITLSQPAGALGWSVRDGALWTTGFRDGTLTRIDAVTRQPHTIANVAANPDSVAFTDKAVWVGDWSRPAVVRLNPAGPPRRRSIRLGGNQECGNISCVWTVAAGEGAIWATTPRDRTLWKIDPRTDRVTPIRLPYAPTGLTFYAGKVWVTVRGRVPN